MQPEAIRALVRRAVPDADVHPTDLGGGDHWFVVVVSPTFEGKPPLARQRPILALVRPEMDAGHIHAFDLKCLTPEELAARGMPKPFVPHEDRGGMHPDRWG